LNDMRKVKKPDGVSEMQSKQSQGCKTERKRNREFCDATTEPCRSHAVFDSFCHTYIGNCSETLLLCLCLPILSFRFLHVCVSAHSIRLFSPSTCQSIFPLPKTFIMSFHLPSCTIYHSPGLVLSASVIYR